MRDGVGPRIPRSGGTQFLETSRVSSSNENPFLRLENRCLRTFKTPAVFRGFLCTNSYGGAILSASVGLRALID